MKSGWRDLAIGLATTAALAAVPFAIDLRYVITQGTLLFIYATVVTQWNLVFGVAGIFSLAQMAIFAVGAYSAAMIGFYWQWPFWQAMLGGAVAAVVFSTLVGLACLRLRGAYVALLTLAIAQVIYVYIVTDTECFVQTDAGCQQLMGGTRGLQKFGDLGLRDWLKGDFYIGHYYVALAILMLATAFSAVIIRGPFGLAFKALRDNPGYAMARGISRFKYQLWVFALASFFTGLAGSFYATNARIVGPTILTTPLLLLLMAMMVVGGVGTIWGPLVGSIVLILTDEALKEAGEWRNVGLGLMLAFFAVALPRGLVGLGRRN